MRIQLISDLHLDVHLARLGTLDLVYQQLQNHDEAHVLVIAGDTCEMEARNLPEIQEFFDYLQDNWGYIVEVPGNHDYYRTQLCNSGVDFKCFKQKLNSRHTYMNNNTVIIGNTVFVGTTLWSKLDPLKEERIVHGLLDFRAIDGLTTEVYASLHQDSIHTLVAELKSAQIEHPNKTIVVVSHHAPSLECVSMQYLGNPINSAFSSDLEWIMEEYPIKFWLYGHSHDYHTHQVANTKIIRNPFGYITYNGSRETPSNTTVVDTFCVDAL